MGILLRALEEIIDEIENYFLTTIYPPVKERKELEEALK